MKLGYIRHRAIILLDDDGNEIIMLKTDRYQQISSARGENVIIKKVLEVTS
jgi:hypothetical protein